jgi:hypothetical protein
MPLNLKDAGRAIQHKIGERLNLTLMEAAWGIHQLANESMASAARVHAIERGKAVGKFPIFAFGGAGPVHAYGVAGILGSPRIIYPLGAGVMSAIGFMTAPLSLDFSRTFPGSLNNLDWHGVNKVLGDMEEEGKNALNRIIPAEQVTFQRYADMRYRKQGHEIRVPVPGGVLSKSRREELKTNFTQTYVSIYGHTVPDTPIDIKSWRVVAQGPKPRLSLQSAKADASRNAESARKGTRQIYLPKQRDTVKIPVYDRYRLLSGTMLKGPAIIEALAPLVIRRRELRADSGGPGTFRGGLGQTMEIEVLTDEPYIFAGLYERINFPAPGLHGGQTGHTGRLLTSNGIDLKSKISSRLPEDTVVTLEMPGGGGFGPPIKRDPMQVLDDVRNGYVSPESAKIDYGIVIDTDLWEIDEPATKELQRRMMG